MSVQEERAEIVRKYNSYETPDLSWGYDRCLDALIKTGLTARQADDLLIPIEGE